MAGTSSPGGISLRVELSEYVNSLFGCTGKTICFEPACAGALATRLRAQAEDRSEDEFVINLS